MLAAIRAKHVVVRAILVVVLEKIAGGGRPFDELPLLEFIQLAPDLTCVLWMCREEKEDEVKRVVDRK